MALEEAKEHMENAMTHLDMELRKIRAGKAHPSMLVGVMVDYYGSMTPLAQVANVNTLDSKTLSVQPWEKSMLDPITSAIQNANLGLNPQSNGEMIMINIPSLTEERRNGLAKIAHAEGEHARVSIRHARKEANDLIKMAEKEGLSEDLRMDAEYEVQDLTNSFNKKVDSIIKAKEEDIMKV